MVALSTLMQLTQAIVTIGHQLGHCSSIEDQWLKKWEVLEGEVRVFLNDWAIQAHRVTDVSNTEEEKNTKSVGEAWEKTKAKATLYKKIIMLQIRTTSQSPVVNILSR